jgi:hypothetical protein
MPEDPKLVRDGGLLHPDRVGELADGTGGLAQAAENPNAAQRRERLHRRCDFARRANVELADVALSLDAVRHRVQDSVNILSYIALRL